VIPNFPEFKKLEWTDKENVEQFTKGFQPYSDFNFVSLWSWNTREKMMLSQLNGNLVILFWDYITETPFLSFIGRTLSIRTAQSLLEYSRKKLQVYSLKLIPEETAEYLYPSLFDVSLDADSHDYVYSISYLRSLHTLPLTNNNAAHGCRQFLKTFPSYKVINCTDGQIDSKIYQNLFQEWANKKHLQCPSLNEFKAFNRMLEKNENNNLLSIWLDNEMISFSTYEIISSEFAVSHFSKTVCNHRGAYDILLWEVAKALEVLKIEYLNFEQDLGIEGLRVAKKKYKPVFYLRKFIVKNRIFH
jgi:hypothetical protein